MVIIYIRLNFRIFFTCSQTISTVFNIYFIPFPQYLNPIISVSLMTAISIDRYMTFVKQELTCINRSWYLRPAWLIVFAWVYGTVQGLPIFYTSNFIPLDYNNSTIYYCSTTQGQSLEGTIYLVASVLLGFIIPLAVLTISYRKIIKVISTRNRRLSATVGSISNPTITNAKLLEKSRRRVLRVLVIVVICFVVCWLPFALYFGLLVQHLREFPNVMDPVSLITYGLGISNLAFNPFIYFFNVCGKSCRSMRRRFLEVMGSSRERTSLESVGTSSTCSRTACVAEQDKDVVELDVNSPSPVRSNIDNACTRVAFVNELAEFQEEGLDTKF